MLKILQPKNKKLIIALSVIITLFSIYGLTKVRVDYNFEQFFPEDHPASDFFYEYRNRFGSDNDFVILSIESDSIFKPSFLHEIHRLSDSLAKINEVDAIYSPTTLQYFIKDPFLGEVYQVPYLTIDSVHQSEIDKILETPGLVGTFFSTGLKAISILIKHKDGVQNKHAQALVAEIKHSVDQFNLSGEHYGGRVIGQVFYVKKIRQEMIVFVGSSVILIFLFLILTFRRLWGIWLALSIVGLDVIWTIGFIGNTGNNLNIILNIMPTILMVVGISGVVHFLTKYIEELKEGNERGVAIRKTYQELKKALMFTTLTTAIGFFTLQTSGIKAIKDLGFFTGLGVLICLSLTLFLLPVLISSIKTFTYKKDKNPEGGIWDRFLLKLFQFIIDKKSLILVFTFVVLGVSFLGSLQIRSNNFVLEELGKQNTLKSDAEFIQNNFGGIRPFELSVQQEDTSTSILNYANAIRLDSLENFVKTLYGIDYLVSPLSMIKTSYQMDKGGRIKYYKIPSEKKYKKIVKQLIENGDKAGLGNYFNEKGNEVRFSGKMEDLGSYKTSFKHDSLHAYAEKNLTPYGIKVTLTGSPILMEINNQLITKNILEGLLIAFLIIGLIVGLMFKSLKMIFLSLVPNILPLIMIGGIMGLTGIDLKLSTSIIFTIAFGIAVDDTIHFLSKFKQELDKGNDTFKALNITYLSTGKAIILTTLVLSGGFLTLAMSSFVGTANIGKLISLTLIFAVFADLFVLPALILLFYKKRK